MSMAVTYTQLELYYQVLHSTLCLVLTYMEWVCPQLYNMGMWMYSIVDVGQVTANDTGQYGHVTHPDITVCALIHSL